MRSPQYDLWPWLVPVTAAAAALVLWVWVQPRASVSAAEDRGAGADAGGALPPSRRPIRRAGARAATQPGRWRHAAARAVDTAARSATARAEAPPPAAAPSEEKRALDSTCAERQREQNSRQRARARPRRRPRTLDAPRIRQAAGERRRARRRMPRSPTGGAAAAGIVSPDPAIRWRVSGSVIQRSTDAGATWQPQSPGVERSSLLARRRSRLSAGWSAAAASSCCRPTVEPGSRVPFPEAVDLVAVKASSASSASVTTADGRVLTTSDGGATWVRP